MTHERVGTTSAREQDPDGPRARWRQADASFLLPALLGVACLVTRVPFTVTTTNADQDAAHFALALDHFDLLHKQPHPPGYLLFLAPAALLHHLHVDPLPALIWVSMGFSVVGVVATWRLGWALFGPAAGLAGAVLLLSSPLYWSRGELGLSYTAEAACQALVGLALWRALPRRMDRLWLASATLGLAAGVRQDVWLLAGPLWLWAMRGARPRATAVSVACLAGAALIWLVPLLILSGGPETYVEATHLQAASVQPLTGFADPVNVRHNVRSLLTGLAWLGGAGWVLAAVWLVRRAVVRPTSARPELRTAMFLAVWMAPGLLFYTLIYLKLDYLLSLGPAVAVLLGAALRDVLAAGRARAATVAVLALANTLLFVFWPSSDEEVLGRQDLVAADQVVVAYRDELDHLDPRQVAIVTPADSSPGFRTTMFEFPTYAVYRLDLGEPTNAGYILGRNHASTYPLATGGDIVPLDAGIRTIVWLAVDQPPPTSAGPSVEVRFAPGDIPYFVLPLPPDQPSLRLGPYQLVRAAP